VDDVWQLYDTHAAAFDRDRGRSGMEEAYLRRVVELLQPDRRRVLDVGCGAESR
jgi:hypothetical protein